MNGDDDRLASVGRSGMAPAAGLPEEPLASGAGSAATGTVRLEEALAAGGAFHHGFRINLFDPNPHRRFQAREVVYTTTSPVPGPEFDEHGNVITYWSNVERDFALFYFPRDGWHLGHGL